MSELVDDIANSAEHWHEVAGGGRRASPRVVTQMTEKYGKKGFIVLEYLVLHPGTEQRERLTHRLAKILHRRNLKREVRNYKLPHRRLRLFEVSAEANRDRT